MSLFQGIVSSTPQTNIIPKTFSVGRLQTTGQAQALITSSQNLGGTFSYQWQRTGENCTITAPTNAATTFTGGGIPGFSDVFCDITYSTTKIKVKTPNCVITWTNTGIPITAVTWSIVSASTSIYSGAAQSVTVVSTTPAAATYAIDTTSATNATEQAITTVTGNGSYEGTFTSPILTIVPRTISLASSGTTTFTYSGAAQSVGYTVSGTVPQDTNWSVTGVSGTNAGSYTATLSETSGNYTLGTNTFSWTIGTKEISIASSGATSFAWTGNLRTVGYTVSGTVPEDTAWSVTGVSGTNAGNYTATLSETSSNYSLGTSTFSWSITPTAPANFTVTSVTDYYTANFTWDAVGGCTYQLWGDVEPYNGFTIYENNITTTSTSYSGATNFTYKFYVKAVANSGTSVETRTATVYMGRGPYSDTVAYDSNWRTTNSAQRATYVTPGCLSGTASGEVGLRGWTQGSNITADSATNVIIQQVQVRNCVLNNNFSSLLWGTATRTIRWNLNGTAENFPNSGSTSAPNPFSGPSIRDIPTSQQSSGTTVTYTLRSTGSGWSTNNAVLSGTFYFSCQWRNIGTKVESYPAIPPTISYS